MHPTEYVQVYIFTWRWQQIQFPKRCGLLGIPDDGQIAEFHSVSIANTSLWMLLQDAIAVYCDNRKKHKHRMQSYSTLKYVLHKITYVS